MNSGVFKCSICENDFIAETYANTNGVVQLYEADEVGLKYFRLKERSSGLSHNRKIAGLYHTRGGSEESREHTKHAEEQEKIQRKELSSYKCITKNKDIPLLLVSYIRSKRTPRITQLKY